MSGTARSAGSSRALSPEVRFDDAGERLPLGVKAIEDLEAAHLAGLEAAGVLEAQGYLPDAPPRLAGARAVWDYWKDHIQDLRVMLSAPLIEALEVEDWDLARRIGAEFWFKLGDERNAKMVLAGSDATLEAVRRLMELIPWSAAAPRGERGFINPISLIEGVSSTGNPAIVLIDNIDNAEELLSDARGERRYMERRTLEQLLPDTGVMGTLPRALANFRHLIQGRMRTETSHIHLGAAPEALKQFCERFEGRESFSGVEGRFRADDDGYALLATASYDSVIEGTPVRLELSSELGQVPRAQGTDTLITSEALEKGAERIGCGRYLAPRQDRIPSASHTGLRTGTPDGFRSGSDDLTLDEVLGPLRCRHRDHQWVYQRSRIHLVCRDCVRVVTSVPAHRMPPRDPRLEGVDRRLYVLQERARAAAFGEPLLAKETTFEKLRARDGLMSLDARDYSDYEERLPQGRSVPSISEAMRRR